MKNIFAKFQEYIKKPKRNVFDMSFYNNLTTKFGQLTPVLCKEVIPGDSFKIDTAFGLQFMPMKFPVQTPIKAYIHFFYVRNRPLWKDWMDFVGGTKENLVLPYVQPVDKQKFYRVGGLADYLDVPVTYYGGYGNEFDGSVVNLNFSKSDVFTKNQNVMRYNPLRVDSYICSPTYLPFLSTTEYNTIYKRDAMLSLYADTIASESDIIGHSIEDVMVQLKTDHSQFLTQFGGFLNTLNPEMVVWDEHKTLPFIRLFSFEGAGVLTTDTFNIEYSVTLPINYVDDIKHGNFSSLFIAFFDSNGLCVEFQHVPTSLMSQSGNQFTYSGFTTTTESDIQSFVVFGQGFVRNIANGGNEEGFDSAHYINAVSGQNVKYDYFKISISDTGTIHTIGEGNYTNTPYDQDIHLNALPFRAYEAIYNAYYRNPQNNPFVLDGVPEYNRYNTTLEGGADVTQYDLFFRNWEYDFLTSAVQSPQQGVAPLVGMSVTGEATFADEDGNTYYAQAILNDQGEITGWQSHSSNMPVGSLRLLMDMAGSGISINDLRNVNAFQRFLENNIRHGLKYRDQVLSHFGVNVRYDELDMPEFIGGCSTIVNVNKVSQTSESGDTPMGSFVGQGSAFGKSNHSITHYCDEHGWIMGILSVVPVPVYSQLLPKHFTKHSQLDYFFPEFGHIGYQPILQKEVSPLQTYYAGGDLNEVFGYNRAWYDYLQSVDTIHSQFRTTMRDFLMNRTFNTAPELSEDFLLVDPDQLNDVFLAGNDEDIYAPESDKIIGSIYFNISAKRPIPLFGIPKLEA